MIIIMVQFIMTLVLVRVVGFSTCINLAIKIDDMRLWITIDKLRLCYSDELLKARKKSRPAFEVDLSLLYGEVGDTAEI